MLTSSSQGEILILQYEDSRCMELRSTAATVSSLERESVRVNECGSLIVSGTSSPVLAESNLNYSRAVIVVALTNIGIKLKFRTCNNAFTSRDADHFTIQVCIV